MHCDIAEYARHLLPATPGEAIILCDTRTKTGESADTVTPIWAINEPDTLHATMRALMRQDPPAVVIQH